jgi:hypothetical protein
MKESLITGRQADIDTQGVRLAAWEDETRRDGLF